MATIYVKDGIWWMDYTVGPWGHKEKFSQSLHIHATSKGSRKLAEEKKRAKILELQLNPLLEQNHYLLKQAIEDFLLLKKNQTGRANYVSYRSSLIHLSNYFTPRVQVRKIKTLSGYHNYLHTINNNAIKNKELKRKIGTNTIWGYMRNARIFFKWLFDNRFIAVLPEFPKKIKKVKTRRGACPDDVVIGVLNYLKNNGEEHQYLTVLLLYLFGIRPIELCRLKWDDFDWENRQISVYNYKSGEEDTFDIYDTAFKLLSKYRGRKSGKVVVYKGADSMRSFWRTALKNTGVKEHYSIYSIRKAYATAISSESPEVQIQMKLIRHKNYQTTLDSYIFSDKEKRKTVAEAAIGSKFKQKKTKLRKVD